MESPSEPEIQAWVVQAMKRRGFVCHNLHEMERVNENGVDIECANDSDETEVIQAKFRPLAKDIGQLKKFAAAEAARRTYVYWVKPTKGFMSEMEKLPVHPLTGKELDAFLIDNFSTKYLGWKLSQTKTIADILEAILLIYDCQSNRRRKLTRDDFQYLWRLKSSIVQVKANFRLLLNDATARLLTQSSTANSTVIVGEIFRQLSLIEEETGSLVADIEICKNEAPNVLNRYLFTVAGLSGGQELHAALTKLSRAQRRAPARDWLFSSEDEYEFVSVFTWLHQAIADIDDKLDLFSTAIDKLFENAMHEALQRDVDVNFD
jgi:hypothetical protein